MIRSTVDGHGQASLAWWLCVRLRSSAGDACDAGDCRTPPADRCRALGGGCDERTHSHMHASAGRMRCSVSSDDSFAGMQGFTGCAIACTFVSQRHPQVLSPACAYPLSERVAEFWRAIESGRCAPSLSPSPRSCRWPMLLPCLSTPERVRTDEREGRRRSRRDPPPRSCLPQPCAACAHHSLDANLTSYGPLLGTRLLSAVVDERRCVSARSFLAAPCARAHSAFRATNSPSLCCLLLRTGRLGRSMRCAPSIAPNRRSWPRTLCRRPVRRKRRGHSRTDACLRGCAQTATSYSAAPSLDLNSIALRFATLATADCLHAACAWLSDATAEQSGPLHRLPSPPCRCSDFMAARAEQRRVTDKAHRTTAEASMQASQQRCVGGTPQSVDPCDGDRASCSQLT